MDLLDPKLDVVFKLLFADRQNARLLASLLTAVLAPAHPIVKVSVRDSELSKQLASDRGVRLDVLVELGDGRLIDVEMECDARRAGGERWLYHWARLYGARLRRGDDFRDLKPVVCVVFLAAMTPDARFHSIYDVREVHNGTRLSDALSVHVVELPRIDQATAEGENAPLERWARFLRFDTESALNSLAKEDPIMAEAKHALEILSREPSAQYLARAREESAEEIHLDRTDARLEQGRETLLEVLEARGFELSAEQLAAIKSCRDPVRLTAWTTDAIRAESAEKALRDPGAQRLAALRQAALARRLERGDLLAEERAQGREEGREEQGRALVLALFRARGLELTDERRAAVEACKDLTQLEEWMTKAATATTADEVFAPSAR